MKHFCLLWGETLLTVSRWIDRHPNVRKVRDAAGWFMVMKTGRKSGAAPQHRSIRSYKTPKVTEILGGGKYTRTTWSVNARNVGGAARDAWTKIKNASGKQ
jgi:hypothetical protein